MKFSILLFLLLTTFLYSQQIKVEYIEVRSDVATAKESLYIKDNKVVSRKDSLVNIKFPQETSHKVNNSKISEIYFSTITPNTQEREIKYTTKFEKILDVEFLVVDKVPAFNWKVDESQTKKILGYTCYQAKGQLRGREVEVYFTKDLPYSTGPGKFFGLPGLILDVKVVGLSYYRWKATSIDIDNKEIISYDTPTGKVNIIDIKEYVKLYDQQRANYLPSTTPSMGTVERSKQRMSLEKTYEWE